MEPLPSEKNDPTPIQTVMRDHQGLHLSLQGIAAHLGSADTPSKEHSQRLQKFKEGLQNVGKKLNGHFHMEESIDFVKELVRHFPHMEEHWRNLCREHEKIRQSLQGLLEKAEVLSMASADPFKGLRQEFFEFVTLLYEHEQRESLVLHMIAKI